MTLVRTPFPCTRFLTPVALALSCGCTKKILKQPSEYLKQIYVDTIVFNAEALRHLIAVVGAGQIGLGTDYPFPWAYTPVDDVMSQPGLSDADRIAILGGTMCKLLKIPA